MDYTYLYSTRIQNTFDEDQADILHIFKTEFAKNPKLTVHLINYYKGLPVSFKAKIAGIEKGAIDLDINPQQAVAISIEHYTFIRSKIFKHDILAKAQYVNVRRKAVLLRQMCYVEIMAERRNNIRLELEPSIKAIFTSSLLSIRGRLTELSMAGAVMVVDHNIDIEIGEEAELILMVPDAEQGTTYSIKVPAKLVAISDDTKPIHCRFMITADRITDRVISKYLFHRQVEIIRDLKYASDLASQKYESGKYIQKIDE
jgi:c-di-GMP-binding flagellar brake protein YcgR